jgi:hypothetical protein
MLCDVCKGVTEGIFDLPHQGALDTVNEAEETLLNIFIRANLLEIIDFVNNVIELGLGNL